MADPTPAAAPDDEDRRPLGELVPAPDRVMRIAEMVRRLMQELRDAPLDEPGRGRVRAVYERSLPELRRSLAPDLYAELERLAAPFAGPDAPSMAELRIVHAQLVGWLEGLWGGIRLTLTMGPGGGEIGPLRPVSEDGDDGSYL
ncbi:proteasome activator [Embleya sp. NPDC020630]|uniref:proteasome activator n=1 Tax=Embleya sp. NPDC020630 TaxID=3363979 RepID=UPI0037952030